MKKINIKGVIISSDVKWIYDLFEMENTTPKMVEEALEAANGEEVEVIINSGGGEVFAGSEIYTLLKDYSANVTVKIVGIAASAASVIAMAGNKVLMSPTAQMMIHNAATLTYGDYREMDFTSSFLKNVNKTIANAYSLKSGKEYEELLSMMDDETWMTPQQALEHNLIDEIMFGDQSKVVASVSKSQLLPQQVINKVRNEFNLEALKKEGLKNAPIKPENKPTTKGEETVNLEEIKNKHPELYDAIKKEGHEEGVTAERTRIKAIDELAMPGNEDLLNKAKFETGISAEKVAVEIVKAEKERGNTFLQQRQEEAGQVNAVPGSSPGASEEEQAENAAKGIAEAANKKRGVK